MLKPYILGLYASIACDVQAEACLFMEDTLDLPAHPAYVIFKQRPAPQATSPPLHIQPRKEMQILRIIFMGTPDFAVETLRVLLESPKHTVAAVVTQPDKQKGRGNVVQFSPVKELALSYQIPVYQPVKVREESFMEILRKIDPDIIVVVAFGQILSKEILELSRYGCFNVHASLLPKYRGAAPIQWAIINGEKETGVTIIKMDTGIDTGDMIKKAVVLIDKKETGESLFQKLSKIGGPLMLEVLDELENGTAVFEKQCALWSG